MLALVIVSLITAKSALAAPRELGLCYDVARWPESLRIAKRGGGIVLNPDSGRGYDAREARRWDAFGQTLRSAGGVTFGYVDYLDESGRRKAQAAILTECMAWVDAGHTGVFIDDARDTKADAAVIADLRRLRPRAYILANPGARVTGPLKKSDATLCESESSGAINWDSAIVIAFVSDTHAANITRQIAAGKRIAWIAIEPLATYHKPGIEYQRKNPLVR